MNSSWSWSSSPCRRAAVVNLGRDPCALQILDDCEPGRVAASLIVHSCEHEDGSGMHADGEGGVVRGAHGSEPSITYFLQEVVLVDRLDQRHRLGLELRLGRVLLADNLDAIPAA